MEHTTPVPHSVKSWAPHLKVQSANDTDLSHWGDLKMSGLDDQSWDSQPLLCARKPHGIASAVLADWILFIISYLEFMCPSSQTWGFKFKKLY